MPFRAGDIGRVDSKQSHFLGFSTLCLEKNVGTWQQIDKVTIEIATQRPSRSNQNNKIPKNVSIVDYYCSCYLLLPGFRDSAKLSLGNSNGLGKSRPGWSEDSWPWLVRW